MRKSLKRVELDLSDYDLEGSAEPDVDETVGPTKPVRRFKRIRKEDAKRLKEEAVELDPGVKKGAIKQTKHSDDVQSKKHSNDHRYHGDALSRLADTERQQPAGATNSNSSDIEIERDWYMEDEVATHRYLGDESVPSHLSHGSDFDDNDIDIVVHRLTPPFLDSETVLSDRLDIVDTVRDKTGDLYRYSKNGSSLVNERRLQRDRKRNTRETTGQTDQAQSRRHTRPATKMSQRSILEQRRQLPATKVKDEFLRVVAENQVVVVIGETGSGKTTQLPQFLFGDGYGERGLIGITQPRRVAAVSVSKRVGEEMGDRGDQVGYTIRFEDHTTSKTKIRFMTDGILLRELLLDADLDKYSCIMMDEAHERSLNTDILLGFFKRLLARRRDLKLIVTSATLNADKFSRYFGQAAQFHIPGRTFPVDVKFSQSPVHDYVAAAVKQTLRIHLGEKDHGDILVFMTGQEDIEATCESITTELNELMELDSSVKPLDVLPIYSTLAADLQARIFDKSIYRKCIVATNIAETSLTVDGVKYVVDTGLMKLKVYNPKLSMDSLQITPISLAQANQRSGRAGRTGPGSCYRLFTFSAANHEMFAEPIPEIQRTNLDNTILLLKSLHVDDINKFPFLDRPSPEAINTAQYSLWSLGALSNFGELTAIGEKMAAYPIEPSLSKLLILSMLPRFACTKEIVTIVAMLSIPPIFVRPNGDAALQKRSDATREKFQIPESDHLTLLNIYRQFENHGSQEKWCTRNFLHYRSLKRAKEVRSQLWQIVKRSKVSDANADWDRIRECIGAAFFQNGAKFKKYGVYQHLRSGLEMSLHPTSALYGMGDMPKYVIYHDVMFTGKSQHMNYVTAVKGQWLVEYGGVFYGRRVAGVTSKEHQLAKQQEYDKLLSQEKLINA